MTAEQIKTINNYLERVGLVHQDVKLEVFDHMISGIEDKMRNRKISFKNAFEEEKMNWKDDLKLSHSYWIGLAWTAPKLVISKTVKAIKKAYLLSLLYCIPVVLFFFILNTKGSQLLEIVIGIIEFSILFGLVFYHFQILKTKQKSSFQFLFKINCVGMAFAYLLYNPLVSNIIGIFKGEQLSYVGLIFHSYAIEFLRLLFQFALNHLRTVEKLRVE